MSSKIGESSPGVNDLNKYDLFMYEIIKLLDTAGAPCWTYDKLIYLMKHQQKMGIDISQSCQHSVFTSCLNKRYGEPKIEERIIENYKVFCFNFIYMLRNTLFFFKKIK